jgi:YD repeat-containing protein
VEVITAKNRDRAITYFNLIAREVLLMMHEKANNKMKDAMCCNNRRKTGMAIVLALILSAFITFTPGAANSGVVNINYTYDRLNRLTAVNYGAGKMIAYTYDDAGNATKTTSIYALADVMMCLRIITGLSPTGTASNYPISGIAVNSNGTIGLAEAIYILQKVAGMR